MGIVVRQSILASIISYIGVLIGYINLLYLYPKFLEPDQIGLLRAIQDFAMLMVPFATLGLAQVVLRYFPQYSKSQEQINSFASLVVVLALGAFSIFLLVFYLFEPWILSFFKENANAVIIYKNLILILTFLLLFTTIFEQLSKAILKVAFPNFLREICIRILQGILVILYFFSFLTFDQFIISSVLIYVLTLTILIVFLWRFKIGFNFGNIKSFTFNTIRGMAKYSSLSFISVSAMIFIGKMDSLMVTGFLGLTAVAVYTTAFYMATVIEIPKRAITQATTTLLARAFEKNDLSEIEMLYRKTAINQLIIGVLLMIGIWANLENLFVLMPKGEIYRVGSQVVILVGVGKLIDMAFGPSSEIIGLSRFYWFNLVCVSLLAVIVVITNYFFIPRFGITGAAYGSVIALVLYNAVKFIFIYLRMGIQPFTFATVKVIVIGLGVVFVSIFLPRLHNVFADVLFRSALITVVFSTLIIGTRSSEEVNKIFRQLLTFIRPK